MKTTILRQRMTEDMQVRNLSRQTQASYVLQVSQFARYFNKSPAVLGPEEIRSYQVYLTNQKKLEASSIKVAVAALRFLYRVTLKRPWDFGEIVPSPKAPRTLPIILSPDEVVQFLGCIPNIKHRTISDRLLRRRVAHHRGGSPKAGSHRQTADGHPHRAGQGAEGPLCHAVAEIAGRAERLLVGGAPEGMALSGRHPGSADHAPFRREGLPSGAPAFRTF